MELPVLLIFITSSSYCNSKSQAKDFIWLKEKEADEIRWRGIGYNIACKIIN